MSDLVDGVKSNYAALPDEVKSRLSIDDINGVTNMRKLPEGLSGFLTKYLDEGQCNQDKTVNALNALIDEDSIN